MLRDLSFTRDHEIKWPEELLEEHSKGNGFNGVVPLPDDFNGNHLSLVHKNDSISTTEIQSKGSRRKDTKILARKRHFQEID